MAWVGIVGGRLLAVRARGRELLYLPGGKREAGESDLEALDREVAEEVGVRLADPHLLGIVVAPAYDQPPGTTVRMACYTGEPGSPPQPAAEIDEVVLIGPAERGLLAPAAALAFDLALGRGLVAAAEQA